MKNKALVIAKTNFRSLLPVYLVAAAVMLSVLIQDGILLILTLFGSNPNGPDNMTVSIGNYLFIIVLAGAVYIPVRNFRRLMNLGARRAGFFAGCAVNYVIMAAAASLGGVALYLTYDNFMVSRLYMGTLDVLYWFGWMDGGAVIAFFRMFAFLLMAAAVVHTLAAMQDRWYGWVTDIVIGAVVSVFVPIAPLRMALLWFLNLIIFHPNAFVQIAACLILACAVYVLNKPILARKAI